MPRQPDWYCSKCNFSVFASKPCCTKCGSRNPNQPVQPAAAAAPASAGRAPDWPCPKCGMMVFGSKPSCFKCGSKNPHHAGVDLTPTPVASAGLAATTTTTAAPAPTPAAGKLPDWPCPSCGMVIFGSKATCFKCGTKNPGLTGNPHLDRREQELLERERALTQLEAKAVTADIAAVVPKPEAWISTVDETARGFALVPITDPSHIACFTALMSTSASKGAFPKNFSIKKVERIQNTRLWIQYGTMRHFFAMDQKSKLPYRPHTLAHLERKQMMAEEKAVGLAFGGLTAAANEAFLFHGTSEAVVPIIAKDGFDERVGALGGLYGAGVYFADDFMKSHGYAPQTSKQTRVMFVARVLLGSMTSPMRERRTQQRRAPDGMDSVCGVSNAHEFIVYDRRQTYPEFIVEYSV